MEARTSFRTIGPKSDIFFKSVQQCKVRVIVCVMVGLGGVGSQLELQEVEPHNGLSTSICQDCCRLLKAMVGATWTGTHTCDDETECVLCESCVMWYQLALKLVKFLSPEEPAEPPDVSVALVWMRF